MNDRLRVIEFPKQMFADSAKDFSEFLLDVAQEVEEYSLQVDEKSGDAIQSLLVVGLYRDGELLVRQSRTSRETLLWLANLLIKHAMEE